MSDFKSKLPDFKELTSMGTKLCKDIKSSIEDIMRDYKQKRADSEQSEANEEIQTPVDVTPQVSTKKADKPKKND
jgi:hypothetical protein